MLIGSSCTYVVMYICSGILIVQEYILAAQYRVHIYLLVVGKRDLGDLCIYFCYQLLSQ